MTSSSLPGSPAASLPEAVAPPIYTVFAGSKRLLTGPLPSTLSLLRQLAGQADADQEPVLVFEESTGKPIDLDLREGAASSTAPIASEEAGPRGPGRPRLGVVAREITLLPRHWDWLNRQPGGASVALRRLVEDARRSHAGRDQARSAKEACYAFISAIAGHLPHFEEAARALFAADSARFASQVGEWPVDVREYAVKLAGPAFAAAATKDES